jgi:DNA-binding response OmpR family regulator
LIQHDRESGVRILCVEDNPTVAAIVKSALKRAGHAVDYAASAEEGQNAIASIHYDAIVLDLNLPDHDGLEVLRKLRRANNAVPVLILSGRSRIAERISGLEAGGDDYLPKPFDASELVARVRALLRRPLSLDPAELRCGNIAYRPETQTVLVNGTETILPRREATLLEQLLRNAGRPVPKSTIEDRLYAFGEEVASNAVEVHIHHLRKRLSALEATVRIDTLRGTGYVLRSTDTVYARAQAPAP